MKKILIIGNFLTKEQKNINFTPEIKTKKQIEMEERTKDLSEEEKFNVISSEVLQDLIFNRYDINEININEINLKDISSIKLDELSKLVANEFHVMNNQVDILIPLKDIPNECISSNKINKNIFELNLEDINKYDLVVKINQHLNEQKENEEQRYLLDLIDQAKKEYNKDIKYIINGHIGNLLVNEQLDIILQEVDGFLLNEDKEKSQNALLLLNELKKEKNIKWLVITPAKNIDNTERTTKISFNKNIYFADEDNVSKISLKDFAYSIAFYSLKNDFYHYQINVINKIDNDQEINKNQCKIDLDQLLKVTQEKLEDLKREFENYSFEEEKKKLISFKENVINKTVELKKELTFKATKVKDNLEKIYKKDNKNE